MGAGLLGAAALTAALFAARLPPGPEFLLPRRGGYWLFQGAWALLGSTGGRRAFSALVSVAALAALALLLRALWTSAKARRPKGAAAWAGLAVGPLFALALAWRLFGHAQDLVQLVWFPWESLDAREPLVDFLLLGPAFAAAAAAARAWTDGRRRAATRLLALLIAADLLGIAACAAYGVGDPPRGPGGAKTAYVALTETPEGPGRDVYVLTPGAFGPDARPELYRSLAGRRDARTLPALRALYLAETMRWDEAGLRRALLLGASLGDGLARSLLLAQLESARPAPDALAALGALADEDVYRVGPLGAARIARAYAHLGEGAQAQAWAAKASIPAGLLGLEEGGALKPGRVSGVVSGPPALRAALYRRADPSAPYLLDASGFVAAADPDAKGRFVFEGLAPGRYFLALAFPAGPQGLSADVRVSGHRGDIVLTRARPAAALPPIAVRAR